MWRFSWVTVLFVWATVSFGQTVLLPVHGTGYPTSTGGPCAGIHVYDVGSRTLVRMFEEFGCEEAVVALANGHALSLGAYGTPVGLELPFELQEFDVSTGAVVARLPLGLFDFRFEFELRRLSEHDAMVVVRIASGGERFIRVRRVSSGWNIVADVAVPGYHTLTADGDLLAVAEPTDTGARVRLLETTDLSLRWLGDVPLPRGTRVVSAFSRDGLLYLWTALDFVLTVRTIELANGIQRSSRPWGGFNLPDRFTFDRDGRLITTRPVRIGESYSRYNIDFMAVSIEDGMTRHIASYEGPYPNGVISVSGNALYFLQQEYQVCVVGVCSSYPPITIRVFQDGVWSVIEGGRYGAEPGSLQFVGPPLGALPAARSVPSLASAGTAVLLVLVLYFGAASARRVREPGRP